MRLKTVTLHPFGRFLDESWDLSSPLAIIAGPNETGKTTLRQAIFHVLFTPTNLTPAKLRDTLEGWFPLPDGDHAAITLRFEHNHVEWTLAKRWGVQKATQLSAPGVAPLADPQSVATKMAEMLGHSEATFKHVLITGHTELEQTIASLRKNATQVRDVQDLLRAGGAGAGDVDEQRLRNALDEKINNCLSRWDEERGRPLRQNGQEKGINDKWSRGVGEVLKVWYAWQDDVFKRDEVLRIEKEIDQKSGELAKLDLQNRRDQSLIDLHGNLRSQLHERSVLEQRVPLLERELNELQEIYRAWPQAVATLEVWERQKSGLEELLKKLYAELHTARRREGAVVLVNSFEYLLKARRELEDANSAVQQQISPDEAALAEINRLDQAIHSAENKLAARTLAWRVEADEPTTIHVTSGLEPARLIEVGNDSVQGAAAGRIQIEIGGTKFTVDGGEDDVDAILDNITKNKESLSRALQLCGADTVTAARELASTHRQLVDAAESKRRTLEGLLQGKSLEQWEQEAAEVKALPQTRDVPGVEEEIRRNEIQLDRGNHQAEERMLKLQEWTKKYKDLNSLQERLLDKALEFRTQSKSLAAAPTVPPGYSSAENLINELDAAQTRLNVSRQPWENISTELTRLVVELGESRSEDLTEVAERAERVFQRTLAMARTLKRIRETLDRITSGKDDVLKDFIQRVEWIFSQVTQSEAQLAFEGSLPVQVLRGAVTLEPMRLSQGTGGALALAIRLAMAEAYLAVSGGFVIFDDPLVHFDSDRAAVAADMIRAFAEQHQVIFLTCHENHAKQLGS